MSDIFLSYAREDRKTAEKLAGKLEEQGLSVFWDPQIPVGRRWREVLGERLDAAKCVVVLWSAASIASQEVLEEAEEGKSRDILVPATIEPVRIPFGFARIQSADLGGWDGEASHTEFRKLLEAVQNASRAGQDEPQAFESDFHAEKPRAAADPIIRRFRDAATRFYDQPFTVRQDAANEVQALAPRMALAALLQFAKSNLAGERVAAAIAMRKKLRDWGGFVDRPEVMQAIEEGLQDNRSRVRYRFAQIAADHPDELRTLYGLLLRIAKNDKNSEVRDCASKAINKVANSKDS